jgi:hypothetical protein
MLPPSMTSTCTLLHCAALHGTVLTSNPDLSVMQLRIGGADIARVNQGLGRDGGRNLPPKQRKRGRARFVDFLTIPSF